MFKKNKNLEDLVNLVENSKINEIEISTFWGARKVRISKSPSIISNKNHNVHQHASTAVDAEQETVKDPEVIYEKSINNSEPIKEVVNENVSYIKAPLVGTFYLRPKPTDPPYVSVGDSVKEGQTICIIEAMKIFNEIESDYEGKIVEIMVSDSEPVEYNQNLFKIEK